MLYVETFFNVVDGIYEIEAKDKDPEMCEFISRVSSQGEIKSIPDTTSRVELYEDYCDCDAQNPFCIWRSEALPQLIAIFQRASKSKLNPSDHKDIPVMKTAGQVSFKANLLAIKGNISVIYQLLHPICKEIFLNLRRFNSAAIHSLFSVLQGSNSPILPDMTIDCRFDFSKLDEATSKVLNEIISRVLSRSCYSQFLGVAQAANEASTSAAPSMTTPIGTTPQPASVTTPMPIESKEEKDKPSFHAKV
ncbi:MAG: hypothetical protein M1561_05320 [Gammaproteobacteria bacterium]|nr:hypothetical protein [Gammaproteobacteria bacterium]